MLFELEMINCRSFAIDCNFPYFLALEVHENVLLVLKRSKMERRSNSPLEPLSFAHRDSQVVIHVLDAGHSLLSFFSPEQDVFSFEMTVAKSRYKISCWRFVELVGHYTCFSSFVSWLIRFILIVISSV